jgi:hypothetical protein
VCFSKQCSGLSVQVGMRPLEVRRNEW